MAQLGVEITSKLETVLTEWANVYNRTKGKILTMRNYYSNPSVRSAVVARTDDDREALKKDFDEHKKLAAEGSNIRRNLNTQVESSENRVEKLRKRGRPAAIAFPVLCALIGGIIGAKTPGLGQVPAIVVGVILGFIVAGLLSLVLYFGFKWKFVKRRAMWKQILSSNAEGVKQVAVIESKRSCLNEIRNQLNDIAEGNLDRGLKALLDEMSTYVLE